MQRGADCVEAAGGRRVIAKANTPSKSPSGVRHGLCPWWTTLSEFIIFSIQYVWLVQGELHQPCTPSCSFGGGVTFVTLSVLACLTFGVAARARRVDRACCTR